MDGGAIRLRPLRPRARAGRLRNSICRECGFTLIEALAAIFISAALIAVLAASLKVGLDSYKKGSSAVEKVSEKRFTLKTLEAEIGSASPYRERYGEEGALSFRGSARALSFENACGEIEPVACGGTKLVAFDSTSSGLMVSAMTLPPAKSAAPSITAVYEDVGDLSFEYLGAGAWQDDWDAASESALPRAVKAEVSFKDGRKAVFTILLRASAGSGEAGGGGENGEHEKDGLER